MALLFLATLALFHNKVQRQAPLVSDSPLDNFTTDTNTQPISYAQPHF